VNLLSLLLLGEATAKVKHCHTSSTVGVLVILHFQLEACKGWLETSFSVYECKSRASLAVYLMCGFECRRNKGLIDLGF